MGPTPFAFSVHHFISSVGADAGFAAIIGLAILVLLYFAQARETATLRDQALESEQRVQQLEGRLAQVARAQASVGGAAAPPGAAQRPAVAPPPVAARTAAAANPVASAQPAAHAPAAVGAPVPPAGVGAPALAAATRLIPGTAADTASAPAPAGGAVSPGSTAAPAPATVAAGAASGASATASTPGPATVAAGSPPQAGSPSQAPEHASGPPPTGEQPSDMTMVGAVPLDLDTNGSPDDPPVPAPAGPRQAPGGPPIQIRSGAPFDQAARRSASARAARPAERAPSRARRILPILIAAAALAAIVVVLLTLTSSGTSNKSSTSSGANSNAPVARHRSKPAAFTPSSVTVAVLNGTATSGLARRVAVKLNGSGYKQGTIATATDQTRTATVIAYLPGHKRDALAVASALKLGSASVQPIDGNTQAVACPPPTPCAAGVVVTVGSDLANIQ